MKTKYIDIARSSYDVMMLIAINITQAIKCCAIIDAYYIIKDKRKYKNNDLYHELIDCTYRDLLMCISRIYDDSSSCNINMYKKY